MKRQKRLKQILIMIIVGAFLIAQFAPSVFAFSEENGVQNTVVKEETEKEMTSVEAEDNNDEDTIKSDVSTKNSSSVDKSVVKEDDSNDSVTQKAQVSSANKEKSSAKTVSALSNEDTYSVTYIADDKDVAKYNFNVGGVSYTKENKTSQRITSFGVFYQDKETRKYMYDVTMTLLNDVSGILNGKAVTFKAGSVISVRSQRYDGTYEAKVNYNSGSEGNGFGFTTFNKGQNIKVRVSAYAPTPVVNKYTVKFVAGENGTLDGQSSFEGIEEGSSFWDNVSLPTPQANDGYEFDGWSEELPMDDSVVTKDMTFVANFVVSDEDPAGPVIDDGDDDDNTGNVISVEVLANQIKASSKKVVKQAVGAAGATKAVSEQAKTDSETTTINDEKTPLASVNNEGSFAVLNLILLGLSAAGMIFILAMKLSKKNIKMHLLALSILTLVAGAVIFVLTEDITMSMILADKWTVLMVVLSAIQCGVLFVVKKNIKEDENQYI